MRLEGKVAVVTGAGSGIGKATANLFAAEGASVMCHDLSLDTAQATADDIIQAGGTAVAAACDVTDSAGIDAMFDIVDAELGTVHTVVNSAGVAGVPNDGGDGAGGVSIQQLTDEGFMLMLAIHLGGMMHVSRAAVRRITRAGTPGSIIGLSSIAGLAGMGGVHYSTAKGGVLGFMRSLAREVGPAGIRVNAICPGVINTPMTQAVSPELIEPMVMATPLRRIGEAVDIANTALFLASDESSFITGQWISPNGGIHIG